jgi:GNAT superfamily N-acetyltransferase
MTEDKPIRQRDIDNGKLILRKRDASGKILPRENPSMPTIRPAIPTDARAIAEVRANIDGYDHWKALGVEAMEAQARASLERDHKERLMFVAEVDGRVVGYAAVYWLHPAFSGPEGYLSELFIRSDASGQGVGTALIETVKAEAIARGCERLTLVNLKDRESYRRGFYASRGWTEKTNTVRFVYDLASAPTK